VKVHVFAATLQLSLPSRTLKEKRSIVKSLLARARNNFNVAAAEVDFQDQHDTAQLGFVSVSDNRVVSRQLLEQLVEWMERERPDVEFVAVEIEEC
jgi:uncharacterized protein YlxP (DUF503 family)